VFARVTSFEIDTLRIGVDQALERFKELVLPEMRKQPGFEGIEIMTTPEGRGLLLSFWDSEASAAFGLDSGYYSEQVSKFLMFVKQPPGREHYKVIYSEGTRITAATWPS
jgi:heme-degrading monooxygenase HmoA